MVDVPLDLAKPTLQLLRISVVIPLKMGGRLRPIGDSPHNSPRFGETGPRDLFRYGARPAYLKVIVAGWLVTWFEWAGWATPIALLCFQVLATMSVFEVSW